MRGWRSGALASAGGALLFALCAPAVPAQAGDLGGGCCADLEERIAELEAITVRAGVRRQPAAEEQAEGEQQSGEGGASEVVTTPPSEEPESPPEGSLIISGKVARQLLIWDDGIENDAYLVEGASASGELQLERAYDLRPGLKASFTIALDVKKTTADTVDQTNDEGDGSVIEIAESYIEVESDKLGSVRIGFADSATDEIDAIDLTRTKAAGDTDVKSWNESFFLRFQGTDEFSDLRWGDFVDGALAGNTIDLIAYTSPTVAGFTFDVAWGENDYWDAALRYSRVYSDTFWIKAGIGYWEDRDTEPGAEEPKEDTGWAGSIAFRHLPTGLNLALSYGTESHTDDCAEVGEVSGKCRGDDEYYYVRGGIVRNDLTDWGFTSFYGEYYRGTKNFNLSDDEVLDALALDDAAELTDSEATVWGFGVVQEIKSAATELYLGYRLYQLDVDLVDDEGESVDSRQIEDFSAVVAGAKIEF